MKTKEQLELRVLVKTREDFQSMRKRIDNRIGRKADGTDQDIDRRGLDLIDKAIAIDSANAAREQEKFIEKELKKKLKGFPIYTEWLSKQKGIGHNIAAWILSEFDIEEGSTVSKLWQYAGLNPGKIRGKIQIRKNEYKKDMGQIVRETERTIKGKKVKEYIVLTNEMIRGDRPTKGFVLPYNKRLKAVLMGVLPPLLLTKNNPYRVNFYDPYKHRLENSEARICSPVMPKTVNIVGKGLTKINTARRDDGKKWNDVSKGHRDFAAKRYMIKMFLIDLYVSWRTIEGLSVREPYKEEYLKAHSSRVYKRAVTMKKPV
jgi:hypothetical protein